MARLRAIKSFPSKYEDGKSPRMTTVYRNAEFDEWVVRLFVNGQHVEAADYHTDDKSDALITGARMAREG